MAVFEKRFNELFDSDILFEKVCFGLREAPPSDLI
jgi:hypothetical protein